MSYPVYSTTFIRSTGVATGLSYTVPTGRRAVVRQVTVVDYGDVGGYANIQVAGCCISLVLLPVSGRNFVRDTMAVAYAGQAIYCLTSTAGMHVTVSGYLLTEASLLRGGPPELEELPSEEWPVPPGFSESAR